MGTMRALAVTSLLLAGCVTRPDPYAGPPPIAVLIEEDPWLAVIGSDMPRVALYENGLVITAHQTGDSWVYLRRVVDGARLQRLRDALGPSPEFNALKDRYDMSSWTDQPTTKIFLAGIAAAKTVSVYGATHQGMNLKLSQEEGASGEIPKEFERVFGILTALDEPGSGFWEPEAIEVMVWPYDNSEPEPLPWPAEWPSLQDRFTRRTGEELYSIFLSVSALDQLKSFLSRLGDGQAVLIGDRKMAIAYRYPFPSEPVWRAAFEREIEKKP